MTRGLKEPLLTAASDPVWGGGAAAGGPASVAAGLATTPPSAGLDEALNPIGLFGADPPSSRAARPEMRHLKSIRGIERPNRGHYVPRCDFVVASINPAMLSLSLSNS